MDQWWSSVWYDNCHDVVRCLSFMWNMTFKLYRFFKVIVVDDDYDDDINDGDILMMVNS